MRYIFFYFGVVIFSFFTCNVFSQQPDDSVKNVPDTLFFEKISFSDFLRERMRLSEISFGINTKSALYSIFSAEWDGMEVSSQFSFSNFLLFQMDAGVTASRRLPFLQRSSFTYFNRGYYFKVGAFYNFLHKKSLKEGIFLGLQYNHAFYSHKVIFLQESLPARVSSFSQNGLSSQWLSLILTVQIKVHKYISIGVVGLANVLLVPPQLNTPLEVSEIPGFGNYKNIFSLLWEHYIRFNLPIGKNK